MSNQADQSLVLGEAVSALVDGELSVAETQVLMSRMDAQSSDLWSSFHLISESLRPSAATGLPEDRALTQSIMAACALHESGLADGPDASVLEARGEVVNQAANDDAFHWRWWAGAAAGLAAVSVALNVWQFQGAPSDDVAASASATTGGAAVLPAPPVVETQVTVMAGQAPQTTLRDPRLDELLQAHRQAGATSALQSPSGFLRNATFQAQQP